MPAWGALDNKQRARWTDLVHRDQDNLAAAANIAGENPAPMGEKLDSANEGLDSAIRTAVTREEAAKVEGIGSAFADLEALGIGHAVDWVDTWVIGAQNSYHIRGGKTQVVEISPAGDKRSVAEVRFDAAHEVGHAVDLASRGGVYSSQPELEFMRFGGEILPVGEVAVEIEAAMAQSGFINEMMLYPYDQAKYPEVATPARAQQELFAQLFGMYARPESRAELKKHAPLAHQFITEVIEDVQTTKVDPGHPRGTAIRRGASFQARGAVAPQRGAQAQPNRVGNAGEALGSRTGQAVNAFTAEQSAAARVTARLNPKARDAWTNIQDWFRKNSPAFLTSFQLLETFGKSINGLGKYVALADAAKQERTRLRA